MTLRVRVADIDSVAFNTDRERDLVAIRGLPAEAKRLGQWLAAFAENQGTLSVPNALNARSAHPAAFADVPATVAMPTLKRAADTPAAPPTPGAPAPPARRFCTHCGTPAAAADAAYCGACGKPLQ